MLGFLSIFHVIGAVALANGLRGVWSGLHDKGRGGCRSLFFVVWGAMFGLLLGGIFALVGGVIFAVGVWSYIKAKR